MYHPRTTLARIPPSGQLAPTSSGSTTPSATECPVCPTLPSSTSAHDLVTGKPGAILTVIGHTLGRAALISPGIYLAGERDLAGLVKKSIGGAIAIEVFVTAYMALTSGREAARRAAQPPSP